MYWRLPSSTVASRAEHGGPGHLWHPGLNLASRCGSRGEHDGPVEQAIWNRLVQIVWIRLSQDWPIKQRFITRAIGINTAWYSFYKSSTIHTNSNMGYTILGPGRLVFSATNAQLKQFCISFSAGKKHQSTCGGRNTSKLQLRTDGTRKTSESWKRWHVGSQSKYPPPNYVKITNFQKRVYIE